MKLTRKQNKWLVKYLDLSFVDVEESRPELAEWLEAQLHAARLEGARAALAYAERMATGAVFDYIPEWQKHAAALVDEMEKGEK